MTNPRPARAALTAVAGLLTGSVAALAAPTAAHADTFAPGPDNQNFATSPGGWTHTESTDGACVPLVLCPTITDN